MPVRFSSLLRLLFIPCAILLTAANIQSAHADDKPSSHDFARWEPSIAAFEEHDRKAPPEPGGVVFVGSSSIRLWDLQASFPELDAINRGFGGSEIIDSVHFADRVVLKHKPRLVLLYAGDNDVAKGKSARQVQEDFRKFVKKVHGALPETHIGFICIKPSVKRWNLVETMREANSLVRQVCEQNRRLHYIDIFTPMLGNDGTPRPELFADDGLHLNAAGYRLWAEVVKPYLELAPRGQ